MLKNLSDIFTPDEFEQFIKEHPCAVRYSVSQRRMLVAIINTDNDLYDLTEIRNDDTFMTYLNIAYKHAIEYTATINKIRARTPKCMTA